MKMSEFKPVVKLADSTWFPIIITDEDGVEYDNYRIDFPGLLEILFNRLGGNGRYLLTDIKELNYYGVQNNKRFPVDAIDETLAVLNGGYEKPTGRKTVTAPYIASNQIKFFTASDQPGIMIPFKKIDANKYYLPFTGFNAMTFDSGTVPTMFVPVEQHERAYVKFRLTRKQTAHMLLTGSLEIAVRLGGGNRPQSYIQPNVWLMLRAEPRHEFEYRDAQGLEIAGTYMRNEVSNIGAGAEGMPLPDYTTFIKSGVTPLTLGHDQGKIDNRMDTERLSFENFRNQQTTEWFDMADAGLFAMKTSRANTGVCRLQWKNDMGEVMFDSSQSSGNCNRIFKRPAGYRYCRVWWSFEHEVYPTETCEVYLVPEDRDPFYGWWTKVQFNVNADVQIYPDTDYWFELRLFGGQRPTTEDYEFAIQSGGLSFLSNIRDEIQRYGNTLEK